MSLLSNLEAKVEQVITAVENEVKVIDGQALAEIRTLLADARSAETKAVAEVEAYKVKLEALAAQLGPKVLAEAEALLAKVKSLFGL